MAMMTAKKNTDNVGIYDNEDSDNNDDNDDNNDGNGDCSETFTKGLH